ncbi:MAG: TIGR02466 family protein [Pseudomonadota bacterium]
MTRINTVFATKIYQTSVSGRGSRKLNEDLKRATLALADDDRAGQQWSDENNYGGYTSYASLNDLTWRMPEFAKLEPYLIEHANAFARDIQLNMSNSSLILDSIWVNILEPGGAHSAHIHPNSVISGTYYVDIYGDSSAIRFEDPRLTMMMAAPPRLSNANIENRSFVDIKPKTGMLLLWESWLRHEVPVNLSDNDRISISFNLSLQADPGCQ